MAFLSQASSHVLFGVTSTRNRLSSSASGASPRSSKADARLRYAADMAFALAFLWLLAAANDPLPIELEARLALARALPAPYSGAVILALLPSAKLAPRQITPLAEEAFHLAGADKTVALRAWLVYRTSFDRETQAALDFPLRLVSPLAGCADAEVSDPGDYYRVAIEAGRREFEMATRHVRSAVEVGRLAEALLARSSELEYLPSLLIALDQARESDREFVEAIRYTALHNSTLELAGLLPAPLGRSLLLHYRAFLVRHLAARRCAGNRAEEFEGLFRDFNRLAARLRGVPPLEAEAAKVRATHTSTREIEPNGFALRHKAETVAFDDTAIRSVLTEIEKFQLEQKPGLTVANEEMKSLLYQRLAHRLENAPQRDLVLEAWVHFVAHSRLREDRPQAWFRAARAFREWAAKNRGRLHQLESAGDPALAAYIRLTAMLPESEVARILP
ncbi:MAG: hypothetical protein ACK50U_03920 [Acidobacteriota bacterium]